MGALKFRSNEAGKNRDKNVKTDNGHMASRALRYEEVKSRAGVECTNEQMRKLKLRWFGHFVCDEEAITRTWRTSRRERSLRWNGSNRGKCNGEECMSSSEIKSQNYAPYP